MGDDSVGDLPTWGSGLVALIDESANREVYRIGALVVDATAAPALELDLDEVMIRAATRHGINPKTELHGHPLFQGSEAWRGIPQHERSSVYRQAMRAISPHVSAILFRSANRAEFVRKGRYPGRSEHEVLMELLMVDLEDMGRRQSREVCIVADQTHFAASVIAALTEARANGMTRLGGRRPQWLGAVEFHDSRQLRQIQAADLVTYMKHRIETGNDPKRAARVNQQIWREVSQFVLVDALLFH